MNSDKQKALNLIYYQPYLIGHWVGFKDLTTLHNEWLRSFLFATDDQTLLAHRGSYKTSTLALAIALLMIIKPDKSILFFRKTDADVTEVINTAVKILNHGVMHKLAQMIYGRDYKILKSTASEITTDLRIGIKGEAQVRGLGIKTSITGKHGDIVITDDIVNLSDRKSAAERNVTKLQYMELQNIKNRDGRFINTGTPWHKDDAISLMPNVKRYDCYTTGLMSREDIEHLRSSMEPSLFAANYELKHIAAADALFSAPKFETNTELIYDGVSHIDAAYGGSDFTAYTIMHKLADGRIIALGKLWHKHVNDVLDQIVALQQHYRAGTIANEKNADKGYLAAELRSRGLHTALYQERENKYIKISTYLRREWANIYWLEDTDPDYLNQILDYTEYAEHDDAPDSAASLVRHMEKRGSFYSLGGI